MIFSELISTQKTIITQKMKIITTPTKKTSDWIKQKTKHSLQEIFQQSHKALLK